jgi:hypothetical protein
MKPKSYSFGLGDYTVRLDLTSNWSGSPDEMVQINVSGPYGGGGGIVLPLEVWQMMRQQASFASPGTTGQESVTRIVVEHVMHAPPQQPMLQTTSALSAPSSSEPETKVQQILRSLDRPVKGRKE